MKESSWGRTETTCSSNRDKFPLLVAFGILVFLSLSFSQMAQAKDYSWEITLDGMAFSQMDGDDYNFECTDTNYERGVTLNVSVGGTSDPHYIFLLPPRNHPDIDHYGFFDISINSNKGFKIWARTNSNGDFDLIAQVGSGENHVQLSPDTYWYEHTGTNLYSQLEIKIEPYLATKSDLEYVKLSWSFSSDNPYFEEYLLAVSAANSLSKFADKMNAWQGYLDGDPFLKQF